ncbi:hypothetical protein ACSVIJ_04010 [Pseudomonas sp. NCHU5208]|uniref:hypothetical protein n=1 Tax=unclassified Pseudomonas TaxID=196821 RepID=UPI003F993B75
MTPVPNIRSTPQLGFDFLGSEPEAMSVNRPGNTISIEFETGVSTGIKVADALSRMYVDDRVFRLGKTNWRMLLDHALARGYTELYQVDDGRLALRIPGDRYGPIARMPEVGPEYVKRTLMSKSLTAMQRRQDTVKSGRLAAAAGLKLEWAAGLKGLELFVFEGRRLAASIAVSLDEIPVTAQSWIADVPIQSAHFTKLIRDASIDDRDGALGMAAAGSLGTFLQPGGK